ncbi:hypothetical protein DL767_001484 [Monosporascus sp. MG133]|nr:hypothetical protein DL767_001484 [Monosporascus sp. MG133]
MQCLCHNLPGPKADETVRADYDSEENPMLASFYGIVAQAPNDLGIEEAVFSESHGGGAVVQCTATRMEAHGKSLAGVWACPGVRVKHLWAQADKNTVVMIHQEEGFIDSWHHGPSVLAGDAVHKTTSVGGLGLTCGLLSAAALASELQDLVATTTDTGGKVRSYPTTEMLDQAFVRNRSAREDGARSIWSNGFSMVRQTRQTRQTTHRAWMSWFLDKYILLWTDREKLARNFFISVMEKGPHLKRQGSSGTTLILSGRLGSPFISRSPILSGMAIFLAS